MTAIAERFDLSLRVVSGPAGGVSDKWPHVAYEIALLHVGRQILKTPFKLGIGHVDLLKTSNKEWSAPVDVRSMLQSWRAKPDANFIDKALQAEAAALLAKAQGVAPKLDDVVYGLLADGAAYFDAQSFEDWAADYGYDVDSRKAKAIYDACCEHGRALTAALGHATVKALREAFQDY